MKECEIEAGQSNRMSGEIQQDTNREILWRNMRISLGRKQGCAFVIKEVVYYKGEV